MELIEKLKYGDVVYSYKTPTFHVAGPVKESIGKLFNINDLVNPSLIGDYGELSMLKFEEYVNFNNTVRKLGEAYLEGKLKFNGYNMVPINDELFMLLVDRNEINKIISEVENLEEITIKGEVKHPLDRKTLTDALYSVVDAITKGKEKAAERYKNESESSNPLEKTKKYITELLFWKLNCFDYSDHVNFGITEREKIHNGLKRKNFIIERSWSKANKGSTGVYRVVDEDNEKIIISGNKKV